MEVFPLKKEKTYAVIGKFPELPRYQGAGSSKINPHRVDTVLDTLKEQGMKFVYAPGYSLDNDKVEDTLLEQAKEAAKAADGVIVIAGLPDFLMKVKDLTGLI